MDAPTLPDALARELAGLRRRAYGPDADIDGDANAQRRLEELESLVRAASSPADQAAAAGPLPFAATLTPGSSADDDPPSRSRPATHPTAPSTTASRPPDAGTRAPGPPDTVTGDSREPAPTSSAPSRRRIPRWLPIAVAAVAGLVIGLVLPPVLADRPDDTLELTGETAPALTADWVAGLFDWLGIDGDMVLHRPFQGFEVRSGPNADGETCLVVVWGEEWADGRCLPGGLPPVVDFVVELGGPRPFGEDSQIGSVVRFELQGDVVEVTVQDAQPPET
ncbi:hypothetical protein [Microbacterium sp. CFBP9034]|uniref:hypothetical protein n=1 Tax=Microbacterium sp. CFBP9034 TaxID=3096540 RepID=UPI002A6A50BC|nr:hypothetical protein [Microbacterium sp. CFBP9034]MDY0909443.1 hypothetical protein [Microbacterium sp. CFBP9034]